MMMEHHHQRYGLDRDRVKIHSSEKKAKKKKSKKDKKEKKKRHKKEKRKEKRKRDKPSMEAATKAAAASEAAETPPRRYRTRSFELAQRRLSQDTDEGGNIGDSGKSDRADRKRKRDRGDERSSDTSAVAPSASTTSEKSNNSNNKRKKAKAQKLKAMNAASSSNWNKLKSELPPAKRVKKDNGKSKAASKIKCTQSTNGKVHPNNDARVQKELKGLPDQSQYIAMDCEMVGVGVQMESALARASITDFDGNILYDKFVRPARKITDYRTRYSGVRPKNMKSAIQFKQAQREIRAILKGKILVGHALHNDLKVCMLRHDDKFVRDTAKFPPFCLKNGLGKLRPRKLQALAEDLLGEHIQDGEHSSVEDAIATMNVFKLYRERWELAIKGNTMRKLKAGSAFSEEQMSAMGATRKPSPRAASSKYGKQRPKSKSPIRKNKKPAKPHATSLRVSNSRRNKWRKKNVIKKVKPTQHIHFD